ncbi:hypothetical protein BH11CYA1_BH11CYA1_07770 [soil metagenome]
MHDKTKTVAAALVATLGLALQSSANASPSQTLRIFEKPALLKVNQVETPEQYLADDKSTEKAKGKEGSCKGKEGSCKGKEGSCKGKEKGKEGSCKGKEGSCKGAEKGKEGSCKGKEGSCKAKDGAH